MSTSIVRHDSKQLARRTCAACGEQSVIYVAGITKQAFRYDASRGLDHDFPGWHSFLVSLPLDVSSYVAMRTVRGTKDIVRREAIDATGYLIRNKEVETARS